MNGLYKDMCRGTILSSLLSLCEVPKNEENLTEVICNFLQIFCFLLIVLILIQDYIAFVKIFWVSGFN